ncbi:MAG TPA: hypothetical protein ENN41_11370 [Sediminispirochaeta sp.]|nr:hypothetical protein [Sediminispirochaeta sp.]
MKKNNINHILRSFEPVHFSASQVELPEAISAALPHLKSAFDAVHRVFLLQQGEEYASDIMEKERNTDEMGEFYRRFQGPWYPVEDYRSYDPQVPDRRRGCSFYPEDLTAAEFHEYVESLEQRGEEGHKLREELESPTTLLGRDSDGLRAIPYHQAYAEEMGEVFEELEKAADILQDGGREELADYLRLRAEALVTGAYREADSRWVELQDAELEVVLGPYEVYSDGLLGRKAMYEGFLLAVDRERSGRLKEIEGHLPALAEFFPKPAGSKGAVGGLAPMIVAWELYNAGEARQPIYPAAFNLPNDSWVRGNVGWKQVMIYNVMQAKFKTATGPIARRLLSDGEEASFEPFFYEVVLHELSHGLGPAYRADGSEVDASLGTYYSILEEAKADTGGLSYLLEHGGKYGIPEFETEEVLRSYLAAQFRSMRFGIQEAHGAANLIEYNWMLDRGGFRREGGRHVIDAEKGRQGIKDLLHELCRLQAEADEQEAGAFIARWARADDELVKIIESLSDLPIDVFLEFEL